MYPIDGTKNVGVCLPGACHFTLTLSGCGGDSTASGVAAAALKVPFENLRGNDTHDYCAAAYLAEHTEIDSYATTAATPQAPSALLTPVTTIALSVRRHRVQHFRIYLRSRVYVYRSQPVRCGYHADKYSYGTVILRDHSLVSMYAVDSEIDNSI